MKQNYRTGISLFIIIVFLGCGGGLRVRKDLDESIRLYQQGESEMAAKRLEKIVKKGSPSAELWHTLAVVYTDLNRYDEALNCYREAIRMEPEEPLWRVGLGIASHNLGDETGSLEAFQTAIQMNPRFAPAYYYLGRLKLGQGKVEEARQFFQKALEVQPGYDPARKQLNALQPAGDG